MPTPPSDRSAPLPPFTGQRATVVGLAREGSALVRYLARHGADVTVTDAKGASELADELAAIADVPARLALGGHPPDVLEADVVYLSPGVPPTIPLLVEARRRGLRLASATEIALSCSRAPVIGVTGSSGKTTTTSLVGAMLEASGLPTVVGGNIGRPLLEDLDAVRPTDRVVLELSSFQLEDLPLSPPIAVVLNLAPDHLDRHATYESYIAAKSAIVRHQRNGDTAILNRDDDRVRAMADLTPAALRWFSLSALPPGSNGYLDGDRLVLTTPSGDEILCRDRDLLLRGRHNVANVLAAGLAALAAGGAVESIREVARTFAGVPNRLEEVGRFGGLVFVNDSIATSPTRSMAAIASFREPIVLLAGGRHKNLPLDRWADAVRSRVSELIVFGEAAELLSEAVREARPSRAGSPGGANGRVTTDRPAERPGPAIHRVADLEAATRLAIRVAPPGAVILLSPACTSFDGYVDYVDRGRHFREVVARLARA